MANRPARAAIRRAWPTCPRTGPGSGSAPNLSLTDNLIMKRYRDAPIARGWLIDRRRGRASVANGLKDEYAISAPVDRHAGRGCSPAATSSG